MDKRKAYFRRVHRGRVGCATSVKILHQLSSQSRRLLGLQAWSKDVSLVFGKTQSASSAEARSCEIAESKARLHSERRRRIGFVLISSRRTRFRLFSRSFLHRYLSSISKRDEMQKHCFYRDLQYSRHTTYSVVVVSKY